MTIGDIIQLGILIVALLGIIVTPIVQFILYSVKKKEARFQLSEENRMRIRPMIETGGSSTRGAPANTFKTIFKIIDNTATNIRLTNIQCDPSSLNLSITTITSLHKNNNFEVSGFYTMPFADFNNYTYSYSIIFSDIEGNEYQADFKCKCTSATLIRCKPL